MITGALVALKSFGAHPGTWFAIAALIASMTWGGYNWVRLQYANAKLATAEAKYEKVEAANEAIAIEVKACNTAVTGLATASTEAMTRASQAIERAVAANARTAARQQEIKVLLSQPTPTGADCAKGNAVVRKSLAEETR
jgi:hypothetical protein